MERCANQFPPCIPGCLPPLGRGRLAVAFLAQGLQRRHGAQHAAFRQYDNGFGAFAQLGIELEGAAMQLDEVLHDGQAEPGAAFGGLVGQRALAEGLHDARDLLLGNARARIAHAQLLAAVLGVRDAERDAPAARA